MSVFARITTAALTVSLASVALASGDGTEHHAAEFPLATLIYSTINLGIFLYVLRRYAWPGIKAWVQDRHDRIVADLAAAAAVKAEAIQLKEHWESRLADLDEEIADMRKQAQRDAETERARILAAAQKAAERIKHDAEIAAEAERRQLKAELRTGLAKQALELAEERVRSTWKADDQARYVKQFLAEVQP